MTPFIQKAVLISFLSLLLAAAGIAGHRVHVLSAQQEQIKRDYSIVNNISFGLLSVNKWRDLLVTSVAHRIDNFDLSSSERDSLKREVTHILNALVDKVDSIMDAPQHSLGGKLRKLAFKAFVKEDKLRREIPQFSDKIVNEFMKPASKRKLKYLAMNKLQDLGGDTYDSSRQAGRSVIDSVFKKYNVTDVAAFEKSSATMLDDLRHSTYNWAYILLAAVLLSLSLWYFIRSMPHLYIPFYILSILLALILLLVGLTTAMIEIDARIKAIDFKLIGETISFRDQVIFFQSKSIVDVVRILVATGKFDSILVGILILCFSIFFPVAKLLSTGLYLLGSRQWMRGRVVNYFAFHSGKWSMADVTVVAIFMAYIGFNGILDDQLSSLNQQSDSFSSIATNHTSLQPGYLVFVAFVLYGLALSQILKEITRRTGTAHH